MGRYRKVANFRSLTLPERQRWAQEFIDQAEWRMTAVRWLSCEPLLSAINMDLSHVHWVVVGGESNGGRKMEKAWATSIRDQCKKAGVTFFFKQWGMFGEDGKPNRRRKSEGHETLDGRVLTDYPA